MAPRRSCVVEDCQQQAVLKPKAHLFVLEGGLQARELPSAGSVLEASGAGPWDQDEGLSGLTLWLQTRRQACGYAAQACASDETVFCPRSLRHRHFGSGTARAPANLQYEICSVFAHTLRLQRRISRCQRCTFTWISPPSGAPN